MTVPDDLRALAHPRFGMARRRLQMTICAHVGPWEWPS